MSGLGFGFENDKKSTLRSELGGSGSLRGSATRDYFTSAGHSSEIHLLDSLLS